ncbi:ubiquinone biosynthesis monooxygenase Coq7 [Gonapodya sp. JEL0774]|nr:ubiquinone biosynthesis monooxygenase Coq7 [Gonapodya sp. JEL0774]
MHRLANPSCRQCVSLPTEILFRLTPAHSFSVLVPRRHQSARDDYESAQRPLDPEELTRRKHFIDSILRVDHAGEVGANVIYQGQIAVLGRDKAVRPMLDHMLQQEVVHLAEFEKLLGEYRTRPSALRPLWEAAGFALGAVTAAMGKEAAMACTEAVETVIGEHYNDQIRELLEGNHPHTKELLEKLRRFRDEELEHRDLALENDSQKRGSETPAKSLGKNENAAQERRKPTELKTASEDGSARILVEALNSLCENAIRARGDHDEHESLTSLQLFPFVLPTGTSPSPSASFLLVPSHGQLSLPPFATLASLFLPPCRPRPEMVVLVAAPHASPVSLTRVPLVNAPATIGWAAPSSSATTVGDERVVFLPPRRDPLALVPSGFGGAAEEGGSNAELPPVHPSPSEAAVYPSPLTSALARRILSLSIRIRPRDLASLVETVGAAAAMEAATSSSVKDNASSATVRRQNSSPIKNSSSVAGPSILLIAYCESAFPLSEGCGEGPWGMYLGFTIGSGNSEDERDAGAEEVWELREGATILLPSTPLAGSNSEDESSAPSFQLPSWLLHPPPNGRHTIALSATWELVTATALSQDDIEGDARSEEREDERFHGAETARTTSSVTLSARWKEVEASWLTSNAGSLSVPDGAGEALLTVHHVPTPYDPHTHQDSQLTDLWREIEVLHAWSAVAVAEDRFEAWRTDGGEPGDKDQPEVEWTRPVEWSGWGVQVGAGEVVDDWLGTPPPPKEADLDFTDRLWRFLAFTARDVDDLRDAITGVAEEVERGRCRPAVSKSNPTPLARAVRDVLRLSALATAPAASLATLRKRAEAGFDEAVERPFSVMVECGKYRIGRALASLVVSWGLERGRVDPYLDPGLPQINLLANLVHLHRVCEAARLVRDGAAGVPESVVRRVIGACLARRKPEDEPQVGEVGLDGIVVEAKLGRSFSNPRLFSSIQPSVWESTLYTVFRPPAGYQPRASYPSNPAAARSFRLERCGFETATFLEKKKETDEWSEVAEGADMTKYMVVEGFRKWVGW